MFRHPNAIFRGLHVPRKLLQFFLQTKTVNINIYIYCRGNLMSTIKNAYNALRHFLVILQTFKMFTPLKNCTSGYMKLIYFVV
jgi:hypothetical protein